MAKLRHITLSVDDMEKTAAFYEQAFEMKRVRQSGVAIMMSDGVVSLAIIDAMVSRRVQYEVGFQCGNYGPYSCVIGNVEFLTCQRKQLVSCQLCLQVTSQLSV